MLEKRGIKPGVGFAFPIKPTLLLNGEGLIGYGFGEVKVREKMRVEKVYKDGSPTDFKEHEHGLVAKGGGLLLFVGGGLEWRPSPNLSLITRAGYKGCKIEKMKYVSPCKKDCWVKEFVEDIAKKPLPFDFSGPYLSGGIRVGF